MHFRKIVEQNQQFYENALILLNKNIIIIKKIHIIRKEGNLRWIVNQA